MGRAPGIDLLNRLGIQRGVVETRCSSGCLACLSGSQRFGFFSLGRIILGLGFGVGIVGGSLALIESVYRIRFPAVRFVGKGLDLFSS